MKKKPDNSARSYDKIRADLTEYLSKYDTSSTNNVTGRAHAMEDLWNEVYVPGFRDMKVLVHMSGAELMIVIPTHIIGSDNHYHVIRESLIDTEHNGKYAMMTEDEFNRAYRCNFIHTVSNNMHTSKISDLAELLVKDLPTIKKLKVVSETDKKNSMDYFGRLILKFMMGKK